MTNVQWKDPARRAHRSTPVETKAGQPAHRMEHSRNFSTRRIRLSPSMVRGVRDLQLCRGFRELIIFVIQGDCREQREDRD